MTIGVKRNFGVTAKSFFRPVAIKPDPCATPIPKVATITMAKGGKPAKLLTILVNRVASDSGASILVIVISLPVVG